MFVCVCVWERKRKREYPELTKPPTGKFLSFPTTNTSEAKRTGGLNHEPSLSVSETLKRNYAGVFAGFSSLTAHLVYTSRQHFKCLLHIIRFFWSICSAFQAAIDFHSFPHTKKIKYQTLETSSSSVVPKGSPQPYQMSSRSNISTVNTFFFGTLVLQQYIQYVKLIFQLFIYYFKLTISTSLLTC